MRGRTEIYLKVLISYLLINTINVSKPNKALHKHFG